MSAKISFMVSDEEAAEFTAGAVLILDLTGVCIERDGQPLEVVGLQASVLDYDSSKRRRLLLEPKRRVAAAPAAGENNAVALEVKE